MKEEQWKLKQEDRRTHGPINGCLKTHSTTHTGRVPYVWNKWAKFSDLSPVESALSSTRLSKAERGIEFLFLGASSGEQNHLCSKASSGHLL